MNVYRAHKFLSGLKDLNRDVKQPKTIRALDDPQRQKWTKTSKKLVNWFPKIVVWESEVLLKWQEPTKKVFVRFYMNPSTFAKFASPRVLNQVIHQSISLWLWKRSLQNMASPCWTIHRTSPIYFYWVFRSQINDPIISFELLCSWISLPYQSTLKTRGRSCHLLPPI